METGFYNIENQKYHDGPGLSSSDLRLLERSPAHYKAKEQYQETPAMILGSAFHAAALEPDYYKQNFVFLPPGVTKAMKLGKEMAVEAQEKNQYLLAHQEQANIESMRNAIFEHPQAKELLQYGKKELSGYWYDPMVKDILCKLRLDWLNTEQRVIVDLKSTTDARPGPWGKKAYDLGYGIQAAWYLYGLTQITKVEHEDFYFVAVEKEPPFGVIVYKATNDLIQDGLVRCNQILGIYERCMKENSWPCYPIEMNNLDLPGWKKRQNFIIE